MFCKWFVVFLLKWGGLDYDQVVHVLPTPKIVVTAPKKKPPGILHSKPKPKFNSPALMRLGLLAALNVVAKTPRFMTAADQ